MARPPSETWHQYPERGQGTVHPEGRPAHQPPGHRRPTRNDQTGALLPLRLAGRVGAQHPATTDRRGRSLRDRPRAAWGQAWGSYLEGYFDFHHKHRADLLLVVSELTTVGRPRPDRPDAGLARAPTGWCSKQADASSHAVIAFAGYSTAAYNSPTPITDEFALSHHRRCHGGAGEERTAVCAFSSLSTCPRAYGLQRIDADIRIRSRRSSSTTHTRSTAG